MDRWQDAPGRGTIAVSRTLSFGEHSVDLELLFDGSTEFGKAAHVFQRGRRLATLFAKNELTVDQVQEQVGVVPDLTVTLQELFDENAFAALPAIVLFAQKPLAAVGPRVFRRGRIHIPLTVFLGIEHIVVGIDSGHLSRPWVAGRKILALPDGPPGHGNRSRRRAPRNGIVAC